MPDTTIRSNTEVVLIGKNYERQFLINSERTQPDIKIEIFERLDRAAAESSDAWNNAGTGPCFFVSSPFPERRRGNY
jgi:malate dehydrogenase (quinone)